MRSATTCLAVLFTAIVYAQASNDAQHKWGDSLDAFKANIRVLDQPAKKVCEERLRQILESLDASPACSVDSECALLNQDPFGATVPIHVSRAKALLANMKQFALSCDNHLSHSNQMTGTVSVPACVKSRCAVLTSLAHQP